jgi:hypothetical protein
VPAFRQQQNAEPHFPEDDGIDGEIALVPSEPLDHSGVGRGPGGLAQGVGVDQEFHKVLVDSDSTGAKKSFSGQESRHSTRPLLACAGRRTSR